MKKLQEKNKKFIKELNEIGWYDEKDIEKIYNKYKNDIDMLDVVKYFMRHIFKLIYKRDEYCTCCSDYEKIIERKHTKIQQQDEELNELKNSIYELGENYRNLKKAYNLLKNKK